MSRLIHAHQSSSRLAAAFGERPTPRVPDRSVSRRTSHAADSRTIQRDRHRHAG
ncbi:hypothetical protein GS506_10255 [Rhodococcus hoagii]|nr:hypothetical protein [Prescottella equi]